MQGNCAQCHLTLELPEYRAGALRDAPRTTTNLKLKGLGDKSMLSESGEYVRLSIRSALQVLRNMVKAILPEIKSPANERAVLGIHNLKLPNHSILMYWFRMRKSKAVEHLIMNQGKVMNRIPKLR